LWHHLGNLVLKISGDTLAFPGLYPRIHHNPTEQENEQETSNPDSQLSPCPLS
jgi:hypothetical protein